MFRTASQLDRQLGNGNAVISAENAQQLRDSMIIRGLILLIVSKKIIELSSKGEKDGNILALMICYSQTLTDWL